MKSYRTIARRIHAAARKELIDGLWKCSEEQQHLFKRMYAGGDMELSIVEVVQRMPAGKLDWAMQQVQGTIEKNRKKVRDE